MIFCTKMPGVWMQSGIERARGDDLLDLGDRDLAGARHHRVKIAGRLAIDEIALGIASFPRLDDGERSATSPVSMM